MSKKVIFISFCMLLFLSYNQYVLHPNYSGAAYAQDASTSQKNIKREKKKRMRDAAKADMAAVKRHHDIQSKATRKRMKQHLKETKKNIKRSHR